MKLKMNYYISDLHFGHENVIHFDKRPFADVKEMDTVMIAHWNKCVKLDDHVFIVGDFAFNTKHPEEWYLKQLNGHKHLIIGNHDLHMLKNKTAMAYFESADKMMHVSEGGKQICLCHFPVAEWNQEKRNSWHIYGHIHANREETYVYMKTKERALNAASCINHYKPSTLEELIYNNRVFQTQ